MSEFWSCSFPNNTWCLSKPRNHHHKKEDTTIPHKILVYKYENGRNIVVNSCIPLWNIRNMVQQMWDRQISLDFNKDEVCSFLWGVLGEFKMTLVNEFERNRYLMRNKVSNQYYFCLEILYILKARGHL